ncbi:hypothetical protein CRM93_14100 [Acetobacter fabarum]|nr:hypothetical protein CRM93_14100 [Acetobacter fabarum]
MSLSVRTAESVLKMKQITRDRSGSIAILFALLSSLLLVAVGVGVDYGRAMSAKTRLDAEADSAALFAVSHNQMNTQNSDDTIGRTAAAIFRDETKTFAERNGITIVSVTPKFVKKNDSVWEFSLSYTALSKNYFAQIVGQSLATFSFNGQSQTHNERAPDTDFYFLLDTSVSMGVPITKEGIDLLGRLDAMGEHCAFACHSAGDRRSGRGYLSLDSPDKRGDLYDAAKANHITLRIDAEAEAMTNAANAAKVAADQNRAHYRFGVYQFSGGVYLNDSSPYKKRFPANSNPVIHEIDSNIFSAAADAKAKISLPDYESGFCPTSYSCNEGRNTAMDFGDADTASSAAFEYIYRKMIANGPSGSGVGGDRPQQVLFVITDGMRNETNYHNDAPDVDFEKSVCDKIKNSGKYTRIAILYTEYLPEALENTNSGPAADTLPKLSRILPALTACASTDLIIKVSVADSARDAFSSNNNIGLAVQKLFEKAVGTAIIQK